MKKTDLSFLPPEIAALVKPVLDGPTADVVFDADGTLWDNDIGEAFLQHLDNNRLLPKFPNGGAWSVYQSLFHTDPYLAYEFSTTAMAGLTGAFVSVAAEKFAKSFIPANAFVPMAKLTSLLYEAGHRVWIVSASNAWCVLMGSRQFGTTGGRTLGVVPECTREGVILDRIERPAPIGPGKVDVMRSRLPRPVLAVGNSKHDRPMLEYAKSAFVVRGPSETTSDAIEMANQRNWPVLRI